MYPGRLWTVPKSAVKASGSSVIRRVGRRTSVAASGRQSRSPEHRSADIPADLQSGVQPCVGALSCLAGRPLWAMSLIALFDPLRSERLFESRL
jgi:hypothetical protein